MTSFRSFFFRGLVLFLATGAVVSDNAIPSETVASITEGPQEALNEALSLWNTNGVGSYKFEFQRHCFCTEEYRAPYVVTVERGTVVAVSEVNGAMLEPESELFQYAYTMERLFATIQSALDRSAYKVVVKYNVNYGYPESMDLDYDVRIADQGFKLEVKSFELMETSEGEQEASATSRLVSGSIEDGKRKF
jgi:hypothetical protein